MTMNTVMIFAAVCFVWTVVGFVATSLNGLIIRRLLMKHFSEGRDVTESRITNAVKEDGGNPSPTFWELLWNDFTWPISIYYAIKGYKKLKGVTANENH